MHICAKPPFVPRPPCCRRVQGKPAASIFKPAGIPTRELDAIAMTLDEFEAIRLADLDGLYQEQASEKMGVSRSTFSRIVEAAHRKIADALVNGKALRIEGGPVFDTVWRRCERCEAEWQGQQNCPHCARMNENEDGSSPEPPPRCGRRRRYGWQET